MNNRFRRAQRGQALIIALGVMFILLFIGAIFVTRIARNITTTGRSRDTQIADAIAKAGLQFCDDKLNNSVEGADWRPAPTAPLTNDPDAFYLSLGFSRLPIQGGRALVRVSYDPHPDDPRGQFLKIETIGRQGDIGEASDPTVFVTNNAAPRLRRELIAFKQIGLTDYLRFVTDKDKRTPENVLGTPPIGHYVATVLGNPLLAETDNPNYAKGLSNLNDDGSVGTTNHVLYGAPIKVNGDLTIVGDTYVYESPRGSDASLQTEGIQVSGKISVMPTANAARDGSTDPTFTQAFINQKIGALPTAASPAILPTTNTGFKTYGGVVRDGSTSPGSDGFTRSVPYLAPPTIDTFAEGSGVMRYRALTRDSGFWYQLNGTGAEQNTGQYGFGNTGVYVNNPDDRQDETTAPGVNGSYSLRADWINPNAHYAQSSWDGPFYRPPGVLVELLGDRIRLTRSDGQQFLNPDGTVNPENSGKTLEIPLTDVERLNTALQGTSIKLLAFPHDGDVRPAAGVADTRSFGDLNSYGVNVVLFAEGNVRVKGVYGAITDKRKLTEVLDPADATKNVFKLGRVHLTIISGGTAYVEGNILKGDGYYDGTSTIMERASTCAILAKQYVCVNTTMFMQPQNQTNAWTRLQEGTDAFATELGQTRASTDLAFSWGVNPGTYQTTPFGATAASDSSVYLLLRHAAVGPSPTLLNLLVNQALVGPSLINQNQEIPFYHFNEAGPSNTPLDRPATYLLGSKFPPNSLTLVQDAAALAPNFEQKAFPIQPGATLNGTAIGNLPFVTQPGFDNIFRFQVDQTAVGLLNGVGSDDGVAEGGTSDYLLSAAAVVPLDIRVEALLYAQERSFFVIPGYSFNPDARDTRDAYNRSRNTQGVGIRPADSVADQDEATTGTLGPDSLSESHRLKARFPFYGEPIDARITIYGAIAENYTAKMGDQAAWMSRWGYIPALYGSTGKATDLTNPIANPETTDGTNIIPDDHLRGHDPVGYVKGDDRTKDLRAPFESLDTATLGRNVNPGDFKIARGLRFIYDPALAMPYRDPTDVGLSDPPNGSNHVTRKQRALRYRDITVTAPDKTYLFRQVLPSMPRLPVCPELLYAGDPDAPIGDDSSDTDLLK